MSGENTDFLELLSRCGALRVAQNPEDYFLLKSQRKSPYFIDFSAVDSAKWLNALGFHYGEKIIKLLEGDLESSVVIFGPAYKGIPLVFSVFCYFLSSQRLPHERVFYCFDRKEKKNHGDGRLFVGRHLQPDDKVFIVDDVITSGISIRHSIDLLKKCFGVQSQNIFVVAGVDRLEKSFEDEKKTAKEWLMQQSGINKIVTISSVDELFEKMEKMGKMPEILSEKTKNTAILKKTPKNN